MDPPARCRLCTRKSLEPKSISTLGVGFQSSKLGPWRFRAKGQRRIALRPLCEGKLVLARQLFGPAFPILRAGQRTEEGDEVVDLLLG
jgi:hypothetical protein